MRGGEWCNGLRCQGWTDRQTDTDTRPTGLAVLVGMLEWTFRLIELLFGDLDVKVVIQVSKIVVDVHNILRYCNRPHLV